MTKSEKLIWLTALILSAVVFAYNLKPMPQEKLPQLAEGEFYCLPQIQEQANKLKPKIDINAKIQEYERNVRKASSLSEAWHMEVEIKGLIEQYNRQIQQYNQFLQQNCR